MARPDFFRNPRFVFPALGALAVVSVIAYFIVQLRDEEAVNGQINGVLNDTLKEKELLQARVAEVESLIQEKEARLRQLSDAVSLRNSLDSAQRTIDQLTADMTAVNNERIALQSANVNLSARLQSTSRELARSIEELKGSRELLARSDVAALRKKSDDLDKGLALRDQEIAGLRAEVKKLQGLNQELSQKNALAEKQVQGLRVKGQAGGRDTSGVTASLSELKDTIAEKDAQIQRLNAQIDELVDSAPRSSSGGQQKRIAELVAKNAELSGKIRDLESQMAADAQAGRSRGSSAGLENAREQLNKLSDLLVRKELEIDAAKKEALDAKEKLIGVQSRLAQIEASANQNKESAGRVRELEGKVFSLQTKISEFQDNLARKSELADSLQKNMGYLTQQLARKDEEVRAAQSRYSSQDAITREELERQRARYEEVNMLYNSLKTQVSQFGDALNLKEAELDQRKKETNSYREEIAALRSRSESLEKELADAKDRQRKTLDDLVASVKLTTMLQEKMMGGGSQPSRGGNTPQQQKADDLKRKIEIMLEPQEKTP